VTIRKLYRLALLSVILFCTAAVSLVGQTAGTGAITGAVTDATGAVIPNATVQATNTDTGQQRIVTTGGDGSYRFALLPPGTYSVKFSAPGFKTVEVPRLSVAVTETPVLDWKLDLGTQAEQITVEANAEAIQTTNATLGTVIGGTQVAALPLTTRNYTNILALSAGVSAGVTTASALGKAGMDMAANGAGTGSNNLQIDGMNISAMVSTAGGTTDGFVTSGTIPVPNPDALQEFKVQTSSYDAGYGRNSGANVNAITKSGSNAFHGTAFEFFRNTVLNANDFFLNLAGRQKGVLNQNQFGGTLGGPIKKDKLFFFASYQGTTQRNGAAIQGNTSLTLPPIPAGDRSNRAALQASLGAFNCPTNHPGDSRYSTLRGGVQVACDGSNISPIALNLLQGKLPDGSYALPGSGRATFQNTNISKPAKYREDQELFNVDYLLSNKHTLAGRFFNSYSPSTLSFAGANIVPGFNVSHHYSNTTEVLKLTSVLTPSLVNEARLSSHRDISNPNGNDSGLSDHQFSVTPVSPYQDYNVPGFLSAFVITGAYIVGGSTNGNDFSNAGTTAYVVADQVSWTHGKHTLRTGFEIEQVRWQYDFLGLGAGNINIPTFADFLVGRSGCTPGDAACNSSNPGITNGTSFSNIGSTSFADGLSSAGNPHSFRTWNLSSFLQDDVKLSQRLTVNLGLRWEYDGMTRELYGVQTNIWPSAILKVPLPGTTPATGSLAGWVVPANYPGPLLSGLTRSATNSSLEGGPPKNNFGPRFGFAWQPFGGNKFVVRGGYGVFYDRVPAGAFEYGINNAPPNAPPADASGVANYYATLAVPFKPVVPGSFPFRWVNFASATSSNISQITFGPNWQTPSVQSYNLGVQYSFLPTWIVEVGYVGSHGTHLVAGINPNSALLASPANPINGITTNTVNNAVLRQPYLGFGVINNNCTCFDSRYNSLQITLRKQFSHGMQAQAAYTWARAFTDRVVTQELNNYSHNYGLDTTYRPQRLVINYSWNLPLGSPKGLAGKLVTGWSLSGVTTIQSGTPLTITDGRGGTIYGLASSRAQLVPGKTYASIATPGDLTARLGGAAGGCGFFSAPTTPGTLNGTSCGSLSAFTTIPFAVAPDGTVTNGTGWGNSGIGVILGPGQFNFDTVLVKMMRVGGVREDAALQFRTEFFNVFNHAQFSNPATVVSAGTFGQITGTTVNPRLIQFALKYIF
jgi:hypothetical protein